MKLSKIIDCFKSKCPRKTSHEQLKSFWGEPQTPRSYKLTLLARLHFTMLAPPLLGPILDPVTN